MTSTENGSSLDFRWRGTALFVVVASLVVGLLLYFGLWRPSKGSGSSQAPIMEVYGEPDSSTLEIAVATCNANPKVTATETDDVVWLRSNVPVQAEGDGCQDIDVVTLQAPLGERAVRDEATGSRLHVQSPRG